MLPKKNSLGLYMFKWGDGCTPPILNETIIKASSMGNGIDLFNKSNGQAEIVQKYFICEAFTTQDIIDNQTVIASIERELYDLCESIAYDSLDADQRDISESNIKILQDMQEKEELVAEKIQAYLINSKVNNL